MPTIIQKTAGDPIDILSAYLDRDGYGFKDITSTSFKWADVTGPTYDLGYMLVTGTNFQPSPLLGTIQSLKIVPGFIIIGQPVSYPIEITGLNIPVAALVTAASQGEEAVYELFSTYAWNYTGSSGNDSFTGGNLADTIRMGAGDDQAWGGDGNDLLEGWSGNDILFGGNGNDVIYGNTGNDRLYGDAGNDLIYAAEDNDRVFGGSGTDRLYGEAGNDVIDGGTGADLMDGGTGNDIFYVDNVNDNVVERDGEGTDKIISSVSYTLAGRYVETLDLVGSGNINATGNKLDNLLDGNNGNNVIDGKAGADKMVGHAGNDTYYVDNVGDNVVELDGEGTDKIISTVSYTLAGRYVETLALAGSGNINATGNKLANVLDGNNGNNVLNGMLGNDILSGKGGKDTFVFDQKLGASNIDHITDFSAADDTIRLENAVFVGLSTGTLAASAFVANTSGLAADSSDRIIYETDTGKLFFDRDGSGSAYAPVQFAVLDNKATITYQDFVVV